ncbi:MAG: hypothetical protein HY819_10535 [Acidobacteria bacterium]|nr:hypothetical protein [Acidobacteriota bacterium]
MRYLKIKDNLYLFEQTIEQKEKSAKKDTLNHIWIYDRSGSMYNLISDLADDLIARSKTIPPGDTITLGWFSSDGGQFKFVLKGFKVTEERDYKAVEDAINSNKTTLGWTCFSEILLDTENLINDLAVISPNFALCFFTDGYPCVSNYKKELDNIHKAITNIEASLSSVLLVGYGDYYNKELMSDMAERFGGMLIHSADLRAFSLSMDSFLIDAREKDLKQMVELACPSSLGLVFSVNGNSINIYQPNVAQQIRYSPTKTSDNRVYILTDTYLKGATEVVFNDENVRGNDENVEPFVKAAYALSMILTQRTKTGVALETLLCLGDKALINDVSNAFTNAEYGKAEANIQAATLNNSERFKAGRDTKYLPAADAFCLLDMLELLMQDENAYFYPYHQDFNYKRIGIPTKTKEGYPKFVAISEVKCPLEGLTWNSTKLNLSLRAKINGTVELTEGYKEHGFEPIFNTWIYRNYSLVRDGFLNVLVLPVSISESSFKKFQAEGVIDSTEKWSAEEQNKIFLLKLDSIPVMNRAISEGKTSATELCRKAYQELELEAKIKVFNFLKNELDPEGTKLQKTSFTPEQEAFLETNGIGRNGYAPPTEKQEATDKYYAKEFEIKIAKHSSLPKVDEIRSKMKDAKAINPPGMLIKKGLEQYQSEAASLDEQEQLKWLDQNVIKLKSELVKIRNDMQKTKFAIILGKKWFDEFSSRENNTLSLDGVEYTIAVREVEVAF